MTDRYEALRRAAVAATPQDLDSAKSVHYFEDGSFIGCPMCGGDGDVELTADFCNYDSKAIGVQFYGIGPEHKAAEAYFRLANPAAILELLAERDALAAQVEALNNIGVAVIRELNSKRRIGTDAPGHSHNIPGIWDSDNGSLAGQTCAWCLTWRTFTETIDAARKEQKA